MKYRVSIIVLLLLAFSCQTGKNVVFTDQYITEHKGKYEVSIPEMYELANIVLALGKNSGADSGSLVAKTAYYKEVMKYFSPYKNHKAIAFINDKIRGTDSKSEWYHYSVKMNACAYKLTEDNKILNKGPIKKMGFDNTEDPYVKNKLLFEDFARESGFRSFYISHKPFYDSLTAEYKEFNPIEKMQNWLSSRFGISYGNYMVIFSPLGNGSHATTNYSDNGFTQTYMFVEGTSNLAKYNKNVNIMRNSRVVFTELDHNFVNPVSFKRKKEIELAFANRNLWVNKEILGGDTYGSPFEVFNEYMTWGIFSFYCLDNYPEEDAMQVLTKMEDQMNNRRGFQKFGKFNQQLISLYRKNKNISVEEIYTQILNWAKNEK